MGFNSAFKGLIRHKDSHFMGFIPGSFLVCRILSACLSSWILISPPPNLSLLDYITDKNGDTANVPVIGMSVGMQFQTELEDGVPRMGQLFIVRIRQRDNRRHTTSWNLIWRVLLKFVEIQFWLKQDQCKRPINTQMRVCTSLNHDLLNMCLSERKTC